MNKNFIFKVRRWAYKKLDADNKLNFLKLLSPKRSILGVVCLSSLILLSACIAPAGGNGSSASGTGEQNASSAIYDSQNLVFGIDPISLPVEYTISEQLKNALNNPDHQDSIFRVKIQCHQQIKSDYIYQGKSYQSITDDAAQLSDSFFNSYGFTVNPDESLQFVNYPKSMKETYDDSDAYLSVLEKDEAFITDKQKLIDANRIKRECERQFYMDELSAMKIIPEPVVVGSDEYAKNFESMFYADMMKKQIEELVKNEGYKIHLALPSRPQNYSEQISDSLASRLEYSEQEVYYVRVNSVLCHTVAYGNNDWNANLIRKLKAEEISQEFGEKFLQDIRNRYGIDTEYIPTKGMYIRWIDKAESVEIPITEDWYVPDNIDSKETSENRYIGGFFEAKLTKQQILALSEDADVRSIYPAYSEYK